MDYLNMTREIRLILDPPDLIKSSLQNDYILTVKNSTLADILRLRPDYKTNRTIRDIVSNLS